MKMYFLLSLVFLQTLFVKAQNPGTLDFSFSSTVGADAFVYSLDFLDNNKIVIVGNFSN